MLGVARSTVLRKLAVMERAGMVASKRVGRRKVFWNARANDQRVIEHLERIIIRAAKRCEELSKLDNSTG
jgi:predicted transcriptional regulator